MNSKKNLENGFTLVELIVVMAMMSIIFGALMNVVNPTNKFFNEAEAFKDELVLSQGVTDALADEVRYSTNVVVLQNYVGVPNIKDGKISGVADVTYDSALLFENDLVRGALDNKYPSNKESTTSRRKGARGQILRFEIGNLGVNFNVCDMLYNEAYYDEYDYQFGVSGKVDENGRGYIDFDVTMNDMVSDSAGGYKPNDDNYQSSEFLYLKNINLDDSDGYNLIVKDFGGSTDDTDYVGFERADLNSSITSTTSYQDAIYTKDDASNVHTWIIYYKGDTISAGKKVKLTFDPNYTDKSNNPKTEVVYEAEIGRAFNQAPPVVPESGDDVYEVDGYKYTRTFAYWTSSLDPDKHWTNADITAYIPMTDEKFTAHYDEVKASFDVIFCDSVGTILPNGKFERVDHGTSVIVPTVTPENPNNVIIWLDETNQIVDLTEFASIEKDYTVHAYECKRFVLSFESEDGSSTSYYAYDGLVFYNTPLVPEKDGYEGKWVLEDGSDFDPENITGDLTLKLSYTAIG